MFDLIVALTRASLVAVWVIAACTKLLAPGASAAAFAHLGIQSKRNAVAIALALSALEAVTAALLALDATLQVGAVFSMALAAFFAVGVGRAVARGVVAPCPCFGGLARTPLYPGHVVANAALALASAATLVFAPSHPGYAPIGRHAASLAVFALGGVILLVVRQQGRLLLRIDALEREAVATRAPAQVAVGTRDPVDVSAYVFLTNACGACHQLALRLPEAADRLTVVLVGTDAVDAALPFERYEVVVDPRRSLAMHYGVTTYPSAVAVDVAGQQASPVRQGVEGVLALLAALRLDARATSA